MKSLVGHPFDTVKLRLQTSAIGRFSGPLDCFMRTIRFEGIRGIYKGLSPPLAGWIIMDSVMLGSLTYFKSILALMNGPDPFVPLHYWQHAVAGLGSGVCVSLVATPIEFAKAQLQVQYDKSTTKYRGPLSVIQSTVWQQGVWGLWRGLTACLLFRSWFAVLWSSYEWYRRQFEAWLSQNQRSFVPFFAGGCAATTFWVLAFPADVIKNRIMSQPVVSDRSRLLYPSLSSCVRAILRDNGGSWKGFYRGFTPCLLRSFPTNGAALLAFNWTINSNWLFNDNSI